MLVRRGERYRIYPTLDQTERLVQWDGALRWLWNLAHGQRRSMFTRCKVDRRVITAFSQITELTELRKMLPWLADVPRDVCAQLLVELDRAWQKFFLKIAKMPLFKSKTRRHRAAMIAPQDFRIEGEGRDGVLVFPKLGDLRAILHRPIRGRAKTFAIVRDGDQWFACVSCEQEIADPLPSTKPPVALDMGVTKLVADSDGGFVENPKHAEKMQPRIRRAQRTVARRKHGSNNQKKAKAKVARLQRKVRRQREHALHTASARYAKSHGVIIVEDLKIANMTASAAGTVESPGTNVAQKSGLSRAILGAGWGKFRTMLEYKVIPCGGVVLRRPAAYSSQECSQCHRIDPASRPTQSLFLCTGCGYTANADTNAAQTMLSRWKRETAVETTVAVCGGRTRPSKQKLRVVRRGPKTVEAAHG